VKRSLRKVAVNGLVLIVFVVGLLFGISKVAESKPDFKKFDLIGRLQKINSNNDSLSDKNKTIVVNMQNVDSQVGKTGEVAARLKQVNEGLKAQQGTLQALVPVTSDQVSLSTNLKNVCNLINGNMKTISSASLQQNEQLKRMSSVLNDAQSKLESVQKGNQAINDKLGTAASKSAEIEQSIP
jgi:hypothetical protein